MKHHDTIAGLVLLGCCAGAYWLTTGFDEVPAMLSQNVPPTFFPRLIISITALLSVVLMIRGVARTPRDLKPVPPVFWATVAVIAMAGVLMGLLGTLATLGVVAVALPLVWGERRYPLIGVFAVCLPLSIYVVFSLGLGVRFPAGRIIELLSQT